MPIGQARGLLKGKVYGPDEVNLQAKRRTAMAGYGPFLLTQPAAWMGAPASPFFGSAAASPFFGSAAASPFFGSAAARPFFGRAPSRFFGRGAATPSLG